MPREFAIVEFIAEKTVALVLQKWIVHTSNEIFCYWPGININRKIEAREDPNLNKWQKHEVNILSFADTFEEGLEKCHRSSDISNWDSEMEPLRKRKRMMKKQFEPKDTSSDEEVSIEIIPDKRDFKEQFSINIKEEFPSAHSDERSASAWQPSQSPHPNTSTNIISTDTLDNGVIKFASISTSDTNQDENGDIFTAIFKKINVVLENVRRNQEMIQQFITINNGDVFNDSIPQNLNTVEELKLLDEKLAEPELRSKMMSFMSMHCGKTCGHTVRKILKKIGTFHLWSQFNLRGRKTNVKLQKEAFQSYNLCNILTYTCYKSHVTSPMEVEKCIAHFLKYAPNKPGGYRHIQNDQSDLNVSEKCSFIQENN